MTEDSERWGRVAADGTVYVRTVDGERAVGSWQAGDPAAGLAFFHRRYQDLVTEVELLEQRTATGVGDAKAARKRAMEIQASLDTANVVGDLAGLAARINQLCEAIEARIARESEARAAARAAVTDQKLRLAEEAEALAESSQWKPAGDRLREIQAEWPRTHGADRKLDDEYWHRYRAARTAFERRRGAHFAALDEQRKTALARKEELVSEAEAVAESEDWGPTATRLKALMREWKAAGRAPKEADDALWKRFRAAQDRFFSRRAALHAERDAGLRANAERKEALLARAEAIDPERDLEGARNALRDIQDDWARVGRVPRESVSVLEDRLRAVEERVRSAGEAAWRRTSPTENPLVERLRESIAKLERQVAAARAAGRHADARRVEQTLKTQREWLAQAERSSGR
jgi:Domain of Unknown Function (DUF349)